MGNTPIVAKNKVHSDKNNFSAFRLHFSLFESSLARPNKVPVQMLPLYFF